MDWKTNFVILILSSAEVGITFMSFSIEQTDSFINTIGWSVGQLHVRFIRYNPNRNTSQEPQGTIAHR